MGDNVRLWARRTDVPRELAEVDGNYGPVESDEFGGLRVRDQLATNALGAKGDVAKGSAEDGTISARLRQVTALLEGGAGGVAIEKTPTFLAAVIIGTPGTPTALAANGTFFRYAMLQAGTATGANTSPISIGGNTAYTSQLQTQLAPGDTMVLEPPPGTKWDLNDFYIDGESTDDGVRIMYVAP